MPSGLATPQGTSTVSQGLLGVEMTAATSVMGEGWPDFLTVEQAAVIVRIGRTTAYELARRYVASDGADGLPAVRIGKQLRVPRARLEQWHGGPLTPPPPALARPTELAVAPSSARSRRSPRMSQSSLPFSA